MPDLRTQTLAIDRQRPTSCRWQASFVFWYKESMLCCITQQLTELTRDHPNPRQRDKEARL
jgi:hypothetical protein